METELKTLIQEAKTGNPEAFEELISLKWKNILYLAYYHSNSQIAEDCAQEAVYRMCTEIKRLRQPDYFDSWMYMVVRSVCLNIIGKQKKNTVSIDAIPELGVMEEEERAFLPFEYVEDKEKRTMIMDIIRTLPDNYQDCLLLFYYQRMNYKEIAGMLGINEKKVANDLSRARGVVKRKLEEKTEKDLVFSVAPVSTLPVITRLFQEDAERFAIPERGEKLLQHARQAAAEQMGVTGNQSTGQHNQPKSGKIVAAGAATIAIVGVIAGILLNQGEEAKNPEPERAVVQEDVIEEIPAVSEPEVLPEAEIKSIEDMIGEEKAAELYQYEDAGIHLEGWMAFLNQIGARKEYQLTEGTDTYQIYLLEKQDKCLALLSKTTAGTEETQIRYQFGGKDMIIPDDLELVFMFQ